MSFKTTPRPQPCRHGFTLIELLVVVSIIGIMIGLLLPMFASTRKEVKKTTCASNMRQLGLAFAAFNADNKELMPTARYMPPPFLSADTDPPLYEALEDQLPMEGSQSTGVWKCPDDDMVFDLSGSSYDYLSALSGKKMSEFLLIRLGFVTESELVVSRDFDNASADLVGEPEPLEIPSRHLRRNNLWGDGHVSVVELE